MRSRRWLRNCLLWLAAGAGGVDAAWAMKCVPLHLDAKIQVQTYFAESSAVFVGQLVEVGDKIREHWSESAISRVKVERWFKGTEAPEVRVVLSTELQRGARVLVFARASTPKDRLRLTQGRRWAQQLEGKRNDAAVKAPDADMPYLNAAGACENSAFVLDPARDDAVDPRLGSTPSGMLKALETMPVAGSGGRLELALMTVDMGDFMGERAQLWPELSEVKQAAPRGLKLSGPSTLQHLAVRWDPPAGVSRSVWGRDRLPAGEYRLEGLQLAGYTLLCGRGDSGSDCARVVVEDRGLVRHHLTYVPDARLQVKLVDQQGAPVQGLGLLKVRRLSADPAGLPFRPSREATFVAHPPSDDSAHHVGLSAGSYAIEWLLPRLAPGKPGDWPWARKVLQSKMLPLRGGGNVEIIPGDNLVTLTLPEQVRTAELRARVTDCKPDGHTRAELLTEWRPGRSGRTQNVELQVSNNGCEIRYQGFAGQQLHLHYTNAPSETRLAWVELQPGQTQLELKPMKTSPH